MIVSETSGQTSVEELLESFPEAATFFTKRGIKCIACGAPVWGTLEELISGTDPDDVDGVLAELKAFLGNRT
jgi:hypothetical protein